MRGSCLPDCSFRWIKNRGHENIPRHQRGSGDGCRKGREYEEGRREGELHVENDDMNEDEGRWVRWVRWNKRGGVFDLPQSVECLRLL